MSRDDQDDTRQDEATSSRPDGDEQEDQIARARHALAVANNSGEDPLLHDRDVPPGS